MAIRVCLGEVPTRALAFFPHFRAIKFLNFKLFCLQTLKLPLQTKDVLIVQVGLQGCLCSLGSCGWFFW